MDSATLFMVLFGMVLVLMSPRPPPNLQDDLDDRYDYVVVGGGTAGAVVAARLSEDPEVTVLLIEAGGSYMEKPYFIPYLFPTFLDTDSEWLYYSVPQTHAFFAEQDKKVLISQGKVLGGSGNVNAMVYVRGSRHDYDDWEQMGCIGWGFNDTLPYFLKLEDMRIPEYQSSEYHNTGGPIGVSNGQSTPLAEAYEQAGKELGYGYIDFNGENQEGFGMSQMSMRDGRRSSSAFEYLGNTGNRENLHISINTLATKIKFKNKRAVGVSVLKDGQRRFIRARKEVILSAGAINSPKLLQLSGIGPRMHLKELGINVIADLPVGENLHDHLQLPLMNSFNQPIGVTPDMFTSFQTIAEYLVRNTGVMASNTIEGVAFMCTYPNKTEGCAADIQFMLQGIFIYDNYLNFTEDIASEFVAPFTRIGATARACHLHPKSRGTVKLRSRDPMDSPFVDPQYLVEQDDVDAFIRGIRVWESLIETPTMQGLGANFDDVNISVCSNVHEFRSDDYWECYLRHIAVTVYHPVGTCKMGRADDVTAVVDPELRVRGIRGLRVMDSSVMPKVVSGNTNTATTMIAEKATDMILGRDSVKQLRRF